MKSTISFQVWSLRDNALSTIEPCHAAILSLIVAILLVLASCRPATGPFSASPVEQGIDVELDAQTRSLHEAYRAYVQGRYAKASLLFKRFVESHAHSPRVSEARWWLARSYEAQGNMSAAFAEYRRLAGTDSSPDVLAGSYEWHAIRRLGELQRAGETPALSETRPIVLSIGRGVWSRLTDLAAWVDQIQKAGVTAMLVEAGTSGVDRNQVGRAGVYFRTTTVPVVDDFFGRLIPLAHAKGLAVIAVLDLHQATWMAPKPDWAVRQPESNAESSSRSLGVVNVLHPDYQQTVSRIVDDLGRTEVDGLILQARRPTGFAGELDAPAKNTFETMVGQPIDADPNSPVFWKWAGWKS
ncbi:MAG TPA: tetratricopeptide repeat protein, partial [Nitrospiraceae bacterium]